MMAISLSPSGKIQKFCFYQNAIKLSHILPALVFCAGSQSVCVEGRGSSLKPAFPCCWNSQAWLWLGAETARPFWGKWGCQRLCVESSALGTQPCPSPCSWAGVPSGSSREESSCGACIPTSELSGMTVAWIVVFSASWRVWSPKTDQLFPQILYCSWQNDKTNIMSLKCQIFTSFPILLFTVTFMVVSVST